MAIQSQPSRISEPFAGSGTKNVIPATNTTPSASQAASWASGFPPECSQPISAGGCPVPRDDVNGVLNWLSQGFAFNQDGGVWEWSALADYDAGRLVRGSDGAFYRSTAISGPSVLAGAKDPTTDDGSYWMYIVTEQWINDNIAPNTLYLDGTNGDDSNSGLEEASPLKTFAAAQLKLTGLKSYANNSNYVRLVLLPGNHGDIIYEGNQCPPLWFEFRAGAVVSQLRVTGSTQVQVTGNATFDSADTSAWQLYAGSNTYLFVPSGNTLTFKGSCRACLIGRRQGILLLDHCSLIFDGVTAADAVARVQDMSLLYCNNVTTSGTATGKRYNATNISEINTDGGGANFFPGTVAGTASATSIYV